jgi:predicted GH43/DUF377 family glycosyl hydrolase
MAHLYPLFHLRLLFLLLCLCPLSALPAFINLEQLEQDFVLEEKQIEIPGYPYAFNPTIVNWQGGLLLAFRINDHLTATTNQMGLVWLDSAFNPIGRVHLLETRHKSPYLPPKEQDPRLIACDDELYLVYNNIIGPIELEMRRVFIAKVQNENGAFFIEEPEVMLLFEGVNKRMEKNWVPFIWQEKLLLAYSINPHRIFAPLFSGNRCQTLAKTSFLNDWEWGELRGGTPALVDEGEYLAFFHSYKEMSSVQSNGKKISHYFMGAYTFALDPPFAITHISDKPIVGQKFYREPFYKTWKPLRVVFPGGFICDSDHVWVVYGRQDHEVWVVKLDKRGLRHSLKPVTADTQ